MRSALGPSGGRVTARDTEGRVSSVGWSIVVQEQGRFRSPHVQTWRLSAAANVSRDTCCPFWACVAI